MTVGTGRHRRRCQRAKPIHQIGVEFSSKQRQIVAFDVETI